VGDLGEQVTVAEASRTSLEGQLAEAANESAEQAGAIARLRGQLQAATEQSCKQAAQHAEQTARLRAEVGGLCEQLLTAQASRTSLESQLVKAAADSTQQAGAIASLQGQLQAAAAYNGSLEAEHAELVAAVDARLAEAAVKAKQAADQGNAQLKEQLAAARSDNASQAVRISDMTQLIERLRQEVAQLTASQARLQEELRRPAQRAPGNSGSCNVDVLLTELCKFRQEFGFAVSRMMWGDAEEECRLRYAAAEALEASRAVRQQPSRGHQQQCDQQRQWRQQRSSGRW
jgi:chromosome segregation ATPase